MNKCRCSLVFRSRIHWLRFCISDILAHRRFDTSLSLQIQSLHTALRVYVRYINTKKFRNKLHIVWCTVSMEPFVFTERMLLKEHVHRSVQNWYQLVKYSLKNSQNKTELDTRYERRHPACEHISSDSWRSTAMLRELKKTGLLKNDGWVFSETVKMA